MVFSDEQVEQIKDTFARCKIGFKGNPSEYALVPNVMRPLQEQSPTQARRDMELLAKNLGSVAQLVAIGDPYFTAQDCYLGARGLLVLMLANACNRPEIYEEAYAEFSSITEGMSAQLSDKYPGCVLKLGALKDLFQKAPEYLYLLSPSVRQGYIQAIKAVLKRNAVQEAIDMELAASLLLSTGGNFFAPIGSQTLDLRALGKDTAMAQVYLVLGSQKAIDLLALQKCFIALVFSVERKDARFTMQDLKAATKSLFLLTLQHDISMAISEPNPFIHRGSAMSVFKDLANVAVNMLSEPLSSDYERFYKQLSIYAAPSA